MTEREQEVRDLLQNIAKGLDAILPDGMGFTLLAYEFGEDNEDNPEKKLLYVSNSDREDVMKAMLEFLRKNSNDPTIFGKDI